MTVLAIDSKINKWEQSNGNIAGQVSESERLAFTLRKHHPLHKSLMQIDNLVKITNLERDVILDINLISIVQFEIAGARPTPEELYAVYLRVKENEDEVILEELEERSILIARQKYRRSFYNLEAVLDEVIRITYPKN